MAALPDLNPSNEQEPPAAEAVLLEGLAMAGLVAVLRQLGDLAELAAEVSDGLQDQVMAVSARGRRLAMRAKHLQDAHLTPSSIVVHSKTNSHPRLDKVKESLMNQHQDGVVVEAPPRSIVVDHIKRCRGPPSLSALDRFDAHGEGACLKRYTDPSFFRTAHSAKLHTNTEGGCRSQTDASGKEKQQSLGFLSMLRQLTHPGSVSPPSLLQIMHHQSRIPCKHYESSPPEHHMEMDKAKENHRGSSVGQSKDELERTSSLEAWLSPGARLSTHEYAETTDEESSQRAFSRLVSHAATSNGPLTTDDNAKQDSEAAETSCNKILIASSSRVNNSCSQDPKVDTPPLVPISPMKWLSVKVHTGPTITCRKSFGGKILKATELSEPAIHSYEAWPSEPEGTDQQSGAEARSRQVSNDKGPEISSCRGNTVPDSEANSHGRYPSQASGVVGGEDTLHHENAFFSAVEQLARMSPPWVPRVASCDRITLRNGPSPIHRSRSILDSRTALLDQIKDKSSSLKPELSCEP